MPSQREPDSTKANLPVCCFTASLQISRKTQAIATCSNLDVRLTECELQVNRQGSPWVYTCNQRKISAGLAGSATLNHRLKLER